ncbi:MAG: geranylgeranylglycerol-phosphate geranylgeranyltransferase [Chitinispirillaceae bacterium]|nr:geranylgeranylglycerol-phosphate geranylgeranyltransferase [Chitinispirillaceae bacterium]
MIKTISPYLKIIRIKNALMAASAVMLGFWISGVPFHLYTLLLLIMAAVAAIGFGNVINDILDIKTDRISHPERPLPKGEISSRSAIIYAISLCGIAIASSYFVSKIHLIATLTPILLLVIYAFFLKGTPLTGNILVGILVAYPLIYGGFNGPDFNHLIIPALSAFLLNLPREIIKDLHDKEGDMASGIVTSASLPGWLLHFFLISSSVLYLSIIFLPVWLHHFGKVYLIVCLFCALPIHIIRSVKLIKSDRSTKTFAAIASLYKVEMFAGLIAMLLDKLYKF